VFQWRLIDIWIQRADDLILRAADRILRTDDWILPAFQGFDIRLLHDGG